MACCGEGNQSLDFDVQRWEFIARDGADHFCSIGRPNDYRRAAPAPSNRTDDCPNRTECHSPKRGASKRTARMDRTLIKPFHRYRQIESTATPNARLLDRRDANPIVAFDNLKRKHSTLTIETIVSIHRLEMAQREPESAPIRLALKHCGRDYNLYRFSVCTAPICQMDWNGIVGTNVRRLRVGCGLTQEQLAIMLLLTQHRVLRGPTGQACGNTAQQIPDINQNKDYSP